MAFVVAVDDVCVCVCVDILRTCLNFSDLVEPGRTDGALLWVGSPA